MHPRTHAPAPSPAPVFPASIQTLPALLDWRAARSPAGAAYAEYDQAVDAWRETSWRDVARLVQRHARALASAALADGARIALLLPNSLDAVCLDLAALSRGHVPVPMHALDNPASIAYILADTEAELLVVDTPEQWDAIRAVGPPPPALRRVVVRRSGGAAPAADARVEVVPLAAWLQRASSDQGPPARAPTPEDLAAIVYTSGTTGRPKGVMLTHRNVLSNVRACVARFSPREDDRFLSFLPLSHTFERTAGYYLAIAAGACVAFARSVDELATDLLRVRPTILVSVPRIYEKVQARVDQTLAGSWMARMAFRCAVAAGWRRHRRAQALPGVPPGLRAIDALCLRLLDARVGAPLRERFGGRLRVAVSGGAPLAPAIARTFLGLGIEIVQGYGMTESSPVIAANAPGDNDPSTVGRVLDGVEVRLGEQQELLVRGPNVMAGYWRRPDDTARALAGGWLHTGDQAALDDGRLRILGRLKEIIVTATGEKIAPADVELALTADPLIEHAFVFGEGRPFIACLLQLEGARWAALARALGLDPASPASLAAPRAIEAVEERMTALTAALPRHGQPRRALLTIVPWSTANGLLTPTLKLKRKNIEARFGADIERLYVAR